MAISLAPATDEFVHPAFFYRGTAEYLDGIVSFVREGLDAGEPVAVAVPGQFLRLIAAELGIDAERVRLVEMTRAGRNPGRLIPGLLLAFTDAHPGQRVRIVGEPMWAGRAPHEYPACVQHEALINLALAGRPATVLCPYDAVALERRVLADAELTHPLIVDATGVRESPCYAPDEALAAHGGPLPAPAVPSITFDAATRGQARRFASEHASRLGLGGEHSELELMVGELIANSVTHGGGSGTLSVWAENGHLICEVHDRGHITDLLAGRRPVAVDQMAGRGLLLVNHLADLVRMHTGPQGTTVRIYVAMPGAGASEPGPGTGIEARRGSDRPPLRGGIAPSQAPLRWQTHDAQRAAWRFSRYLHNEHDEPDAPGANGGDRSAQLRPALDALAASTSISEQVEQWRARLVRAARRRGARWNEIGAALGVSKQAAHERYGETRRRTTELDGAGATSTTSTAADV